MLKRRPINLVPAKRKTRSRSSFESRTHVTMKFVRLKDGRLVPIQPDGMVDIALREMGAELVEIEELPEGSDGGRKAEDK